MILVSDNKTGNTEWEENIQLKSKHVRVFSSIQFGLIRQSIDITFGDWGKTREKPVLNTMEDWIRRKKWSFWNNLRTVVGELLACEQTVAGCYQWRIHKVRLYFVIVLVISVCLKVVLVTWLSPCERDVTKRLFWFSPPGKSSVLFVLR